MYNLNLYRSYGSFDDEDVKMIKHTFLGLEICPNHDDSYDDSSDPIE